MLTLEKKETINVSRIYNNFKMSQEC